MKIEIYHQIIGITTKDKYNNKCYQINFLIYILKLTGYNKEYCNRKSIDNLH